MRMVRSRGAQNAAKGLLIAVAVIIAVLISLMVWLNRQMKPVIAEAAEASVTKWVTKQTGQLLSELESPMRSYETLVDFHYDGNGDLAAVSIDIDAAREVQRMVTTGLEEVLSASEEQTISVSASSLTGITLLSSWNVKIPITVRPITWVESEIDSQLTEIGINQMLHQINILVTTDVTILIPGGSCTAKVESKVPLVESVLLAQVPESYTYFSSKAEG